jgi:hypothetical protein
VLADGGVGFGGLLEVVVPVAVAVVGVDAIITDEGFRARMGSA